MILYNMCFLKPRSSEVKEIIISLYGNMTI